MSGKRSRLTDSPPVRRRYLSGVAGSMGRLGLLVGTDDALHVEKPLLYSLRYEGRQAHDACPRVTARRLGAVVSLDLVTAGPP